MFIEIFIPIFFAVSIILIILSKPTSVKINILGLKLELDFKKSDDNKKLENDINSDNEKEN